MLFSLRNQIILLCTLLVLVPISILTFILAGKTEDMIRHSIVTSTGQTIEQYVSYVDNLTTQAEDLSNRIMSNPVTQEYVSSEKNAKLMQNEKAMIRMEFKKFLSYVYTNNRNSLSIGVFSNASGGIWTLDQSFRDNPWYKEYIMNGNRWTGLHKDQEQPDQGMRSQAINSYITPLIDLLSFNSIGIIKVNFSTKLLSQPLENTKWGKTGHLFLVTGGGNLVLNQGMDRIDFLRAHINLIKQSANSEFRSVKDNGNPVLLFSRTIKTIPDWYVVGVVPEDELFKPIEKVRWLMIVVSGILFICTIAASVAISIGITRPLSRLSDAMRWVEQGDFKKAEVNVPNVKRRNEVGFVIMVFKKMIDRLNHFIETEYITNIRRKNAEYKALLLQINPHFLNNTLEIIGGLAAQGKNEEVIVITEQFGEMMSYSLNLSEDTVFLSDELEYIKNYTSIMESRFGDRLQVSIHVEEETLDYKIIKFILQPIIENAIKYSIEYREISIVTVRIRIEGGFLNIIISDNGWGMDSGLIQEIYASLEQSEAPELLFSDGNHIGLRNVISRCRLYYAEQFNITINSELDQGTTMILRLPVRRLFHV